MTSDVARVRACHATLHHHQSCIAHAMAEQQQHQAVAAAQEPHFLPLVSSGETDHDSSDEEMMKTDAIPTNEDSEEEESYWKHGDPNTNEMKPDDLYDANMDDENEAWVYKYRRGGVEESVKIQRPGGQTTKLEQAVLLKPRNSDAVLSCPCCFEIVCMDCQQHERYLNQYRAMFVMNIRVDWNHELVYSEAQNGLVDKPTSSSAHHTCTSRTREFPSLLFCAMQCLSNTSGCTGYEGRNLSLFRMFIVGLLRRRSDET